MTALFTLELNYNLYLFFSSLLLSMNISHSLLFIGRCYVSPDKLTETPCPEVTVLADILVRSASIYKNQDALGWRELIRMVSEEKEVTKTIGGKQTKEMKTWLYYEMGDYQYWSYKQFAENVALAGSALVKTGHTKDTIFNIYSATSHKWQLMANGK